NIGRWNTARTASASTGARGMGLPARSSRGRVTASTTTTAASSPTRWSSTARQNRRAPRLAAARTVPGASWAENPHRGSALLGERQLRPAVGELQPLVAGVLVARFLGEAQA